MVNERNERIRERERERNGKTERKNGIERERRKRRGRRKGGERLEVYKCEREQEEEVFVACRGRGEEGTYLLRGIVWTISPGAEAKRVFSPVGIKRRFFFYSVTNR